MNIKVRDMIQAHIQKIRESMGDQIALEYNLHAIQEIINTPEEALNSAGVAVRNSDEST